MNAAYDVVVVGARVAGSLIAAMLGDVGLSVLLVDSQHFPSDTLSSHLFRGAGLITVLDRMNVLATVESTGAPRLYRNYNYSDGMLQPNPRPPHPGRLGFCMSVRRVTLDSILVDRALQAPSVTFMPGTTVRMVHQNDGRVTGVRLQTPGGVHDVSARLVIGADGRHSTIAREVQAATEVEAPAVRALYYRTVENFTKPWVDQPDGAEFSLRGDEMAYGLPSDNGVACIAVSVNMERFRWMRSDLETRFNEVIGEHTPIADRVATATPISGVKGSGPQRNYVRVPAGPGWALLGDAGVYQDPWSGQGMDLAGVHATYLAESVISWMQHGECEHAAMAKYHTRRNEHALPVFGNTTRLANDLSELAGLWGFPPREDHRSAAPRSTAAVTAGSPGPSMAIAAG